MGLSLRSGACRGFWPTGGHWGWGPSSGCVSRPGLAAPVVRRLRGLVSPLSPRLDSARDWRVQEVLAWVVRPALGIGVKSGIQIEV